MQELTGDLRALVRWAIQGTAGDGHVEVLAHALPVGIAVARLVLPIWTRARPDDARVPEALAAAEATLAQQDGSEARARTAMDAALDAREEEAEHGLAMVARAAASVAGIAGGYPGELADAIEATVFALAAHGGTSEVDAAARVTAVVRDVLGK